MKIILQELQTKYESPKDIEGSILRTKLEDLDTEI